MLDFSRLKCLEYQSVYCKCSLLQYFLFKKSRIHGVFHNFTYFCCYASKITKSLKSLRRSKLIKIIINFSKLKCFPPPLDITQFRNGNDFLLHAVCYEERACQLLKFFFLSALIIDSFQIFLTYFQKPMRFYLLPTKDSFMGKA